MDNLTLLEPGPSPIADPIEESSDGWEDEPEELLPHHEPPAIKSLLTEMSEEQMQRYEVYRRAHLPKNIIKKLIQSKLNQPIPPSILIIISGCAKMFIGEMVESAIEVMAEWGDSGPIRPKHLREAYRRSRIEKGNLYKKRLFD